MRRCTSLLFIAWLSGAASLYACSAPDSSGAGSESSVLSTFARPAQTAAGAGTGLVFQIDADHARMVAQLEKLIDAYDDANPDAVLALLSDPVAAWGDCAGATFVGVTRPTPKAELTAFFKARFADHDQLEIGSISNSNPDPTSNRVLGVAFARRSNDSLRALGFPNGVAGPQTNKTVFDAHFLVTAFANASGPQDCRPR